MNAINELRNANEEVVRRLRCQHATDKLLLTDAALMVKAAERLERHGETELADTLCAAARIAIEAVQ